MSETSSIGDRIHAKRIALGLTQEALAERVGVSYTAISQYERDLHVPGLTVALNLARALQISLYYLATGKECGK